MRVLILGAGGHGETVANVLLAMQQAGQGIEPVGYLDDNPATWGTVRLTLPVLGPMAALHATAHDAIILGIGDNRRRKELYERLCAQGETFVTAIHPSCVVSTGTSVGPGTVCSALSTIGTAVQVGANVTLGANMLLGHHTVVEDHAFVASGATFGGEIHVGEGALIGLGAVVMSRCNVGAWATVGAGGVVTKHVSPGATVVGNPARPIAAKKQQP